MQRFPPLVDKLKDSRLHRRAVHAVRVCPHDRTFGRTFGRPRGLAVRRPDLRSSNGRRFCRCIVNLYFLPPRRQNFFHTWHDAVKRRSHRRGDPQRGKQGKNPNGRTGHQSGNRPARRPAAPSVLPVPSVPPAPHALQPVRRYIFPVRPGRDQPATCLQKSSADRMRRGTGTADKTNLPRAAALPFRIWKPSRRRRPTPRACGRTPRATLRAARASRRRPGRRPRRASPRRPSRPRPACRCARRRPPWRWPR